MQDVRGVNVVPGVAVGYSVSGTQRVGIVTDVNDPEGKVTIEWTHGAEGVSTVKADAAKGSRLVVLT